MKKEKFNLDKPKKEAKKHEKKSISLINELKIDQEEKESENFLYEELEAKFWRDLYKEKLKEIKNKKDFKKVAFEDLEKKIKSGQNGKGRDANRALWDISSYKNLGIFEKKVEEKLKEIKNDKNFKKAAIKRLENRIKSSQNGDGWDASQALRDISSYKNLGIFEKQVKEKLELIKDNKDFKKAAIKNLEERIKSGQNGNGWHANLALRRISSYKNLGIFEKQAKEKLELIKGDQNFEKAAIDDLEKDIKSGQDGNGFEVNWALRRILSYKTISEFWQDLANQKRAKMARKNQKQDIPKRPEIR